MENIQIDLTALSPLETPSVDVAPLDQAGKGDVFVPENVCPKMIHYAVEDHKLAHLHFTGGCEGNLKAIARLVEGMEIDQVVDKLSGITCGNKPTSCTDQLCIALRGHMEEDA